MLNFDQKSSNLISFDQKRSFLVKFDQRVEKSYNMQKYHRNISIHWKGPDSGFPMSIDASMVFRLYMHLMPAFRTDGPRKLTICFCWYITIFEFVFKQWPTSTGIEVIQNPEYHNNMYIQWKELNSSFSTCIDTPMFLAHYIWLRRTSLKLGPEVTIPNLESTSEKP